jgi:hypothetical protein
MVSEEVINNMTREEYDNLPSWQDRDETVCPSPGDRFKFKHPFTPQYDDYIEVEIEDDGGIKTMAFLVKCFDP